MTLYVSFILHIYQPPTQQPSILKKIIKESYVPLFNLLIKNPKIKITFNINGSLLELFEFYQEKDLLEKIKTLIYRNQIDLLGSSCYHAILPLIPTEEIIRQIELNEEIHQRVLGENMIRSKGFWLPEMAYDSRVVEPLLKKNYSWTTISSVATPEKQLPDNFVPILNSDFSIFFRNDLLSNFISFNHPSVNEFYQAIKGDKNPLKDDYYVILAMDGETYGHHVKNLIEDFLEPFLMKIINDPNMQLVRVAELLEIFHSKKKVQPYSSSWSTTDEDIQQGNPFPLWSDPHNKIHTLQLKVMSHTLFLVEQAQKNYNCSKSVSIDLKQRFCNSRSWLDQGLHSCQLWWASGRPWYSSEMILKGLNQLILSSSEALKVILNLSDNDSDKKKALRVFDEICEAQKEIYLIV